MCCLLTLSMSGAGSVWSFVGCRLCAVQISTNACGSVTCSRSKKLRLFCTCLRSFEQGNPNRSCFLLQNCENLMQRCGDMRSFRSSFSVLVVSDFALVRSGVVFRFGARGLLKAEAMDSSSSTRSRCPVSSAGKPGEESEVVAFAVRAGPL